MSHCGNCKDELNPKNTPMLGSGVLKSGESICKGCFKSLIKTHPNIKISSLVLGDLQNILSKVDTLSCSKCGSTNLERHKRGISFWWSFFCGVLIGMIGRNDMVYTCLSCGHEFDEI